MDFKHLPAQYDYAAAQAKWIRFGKNGATCSERRPSDKRPPYTIVIPPPNVTGALHLGHALNNTLQDILIRMKRMQGFNALWMPGTDHAGIATQAVVERRLFEEEKKTRHDLGREGARRAHLEVEGRVRNANPRPARKRWAAAAIGSGRGSRSMTSVRRAVRHTFFSLFQDGLIYRGKRLVNWDTFLQTAVSDDEVDHETVEGALLALQVSGHEPEAGRADARHDRDHAARDDARRYGGGRASRSGRGARRGEAGAAREACRRASPKRQADDSGHKSTLGERRTTTCRL